MDFAARFTQASKASTLERMVLRLVKDMRLHFDPARSSLKSAALSYKKLGNMKAFEMFMAAHTREQEIEGPQQVNTKMQVDKPNKGQALQNALERELQSWNTSR